MPRPISYVLSSMLILFLFGGQINWVEIRWNWRALIITWIIRTVPRYCFYFGGIVQGTLLPVLSMKLSEMIQHNIISIMVLVQLCFLRTYFPKLHPITCTWHRPCVSHVWRILPTLPYFHVDTFVFVERAFAVRAYCVAGSVRLVVVR